MSTATTTQPDNGPTTKAGKAADFLDQRTGIGVAVKEFARKVFPDHWSFMLGEIALYSFIVLIITGIFLTMFFVPSMGLTTYHGPVETMHGLEMSEAFASTLRLSFEVRGGLLIRQIHHWAALIFVAAMVVHMMRIFFTGAFRKPREINWMIGFLLLVLGLLAGFSGYSLPDDVLSGNGLRITDGVVKSIPLIGSYMSYMIFGGEFPGHDIIPRLFTVHVLLIPGLILALVAVHLVLVVVHKHTQYPGGGRTDNNVVGFPLFPVYTAKAGGFFFVVFGVLSLMGALLAINNVWNYGPYDPSPVSAGAQPDWYMLFLEGSLRLMPGQAEVVIGGYTLSLNVLVPAAIIPALLLGFIAMYPFIESWVTKDNRPHSVLDRPRNVPTRTGLGVAFLTAFGILVLAGSNDLIATHFELSLNAITWVFRFAFFLLPVITFWVTKRICLSLQRKDRELVLHGHEHGRIIRTEEGEYFEVHKPLNDEERWLRVNYRAHAPLILEEQPYDEKGKRNKGYRRAKFRARVSRFFYEDRIEPVTPAELAAAHGDDHSHSIAPDADRPAIH
ncbi:cytochrome bc complex cytochrome b subunit [Rarobacter faecitabidus]|uniref:Cytochrome bc1 complex cytochrome b subunit n=1 Tax=Rarobacter faecitabidus TaxID=13243 RepID=A0A542ZVW7_RARFA|nr:cytochrome bc complex cytochrome b subunit [Rarobacter faecitabidus]TQL64330.1 menaquinol-cytochrome c reductase cytochrome b subunit precursor [Rarobacter faecitabidus]